MINTPDASLYRGYADLAARQELNKDYEIVAEFRPSSRVAVIAPHGGAIERGTSRIARALAGENFSLFMLEGIRRTDNYAALHLSSRYFDEPNCLKVVSECPIVVAVHGCKGTDEKVLLGGRDDALKNQLAAAIRSVGVAAETIGHAFPAVDTDNICNRGSTGKGVQLEFTAALRGAGTLARVESAIRSELLKANAAAQP